MPITTAAAEVPRFTRLRYSLTRRREAPRRAGHPRRHGRDDPLDELTWPHRVMTGGLSPPVAGCREKAAMTPAAPRATGTHVIGAASRQAARGWIDQAARRHGPWLTGGRVRERQVILPSRETNGHCGARGRPAGGPAPRGRRRGRPPAEDDRRAGRRREHVPVRPRRVDSSRPVRRLQLPVPRLASYCGSPISRVALGCSASSPAHLRHSTSWPRSRRRPVAPSSIALRGRPHRFRSRCLRRPGQQRRRAPHVPGSATSYRRSTASGSGPSSTKNLEQGRRHRPRGRRRHDAQTTLIQSRPRPGAHVVVELGGAGERVAKLARVDPIEGRVVFEAGPAANNPGLRAVLRRYARQRDEATHP
jgi:hypothetical protein